MGVNQVYIEQTTFAQGSFGYRCVICRGTDYFGKAEGHVVHKPNCTQAYRLEIAQTVGLFNDRL